MISHLGRNIGFEQNGGGGNFSRPVLIIKKFNNQMFWSIPLSTKQKKIDFYFNYVDPEGQNAAAIIAQMRLLSVKRLNRKLYDLKPQIMVEIRERIRSFI